MRQLPGFGVDLRKPHLVSPFIQNLLRRARVFVTENEQMQGYLPSCRSKLCLLLEKLVFIDSSVLVDTFYKLTFTYSPDLERCIDQRVGAFSIRNSSP
jgi:hypothetical protein